MNENEVKVQAFFQQILNDLNAKKPVSLLLYTYVKEDGLGDAAQLGYLRKELAERMPMLPLKVVIGCDDIMLEAKQAQIRELVGGDDVTFFICESNDTRVLKPSNYGCTYMIQYPFPAFRYEEATTLCIYEMGTTREGCVKTGLSENGIGYGIPSLPKEKESDGSDSWLISAKPFIQPGGGMQDFGLEKKLQLHQESRLTDDPALKRHLIMLNQIKSFQSAYTVKALWLNSVLHTYLTRFPKDAAAKDMVLPSVSAEQIAQSLADKAAGVVVCGGEGLFCQCLAMPHDVPVVFACRYGFQYREIAYTLKGLETCGSAKVGEITAELAQQYRIFFVGDKISHLLYAVDDHHYYDLLEQKLLSLKPEVSLCSSKALSALALPMFLNMQPNRYIQLQWPQIFKDPVNEMLEYHLRLKQELAKKNWFHLIPDIKES